MKRWRARLVVLVAVVGLIGGGLWFWLAYCPASCKDELVLYGNVDIRQVELAFNAAERIDRLLVNEGDSVEKGQLLATLDMRRLELNVARAEARVEAQRQVVARLKAGTRPEEIRKARATLEAAEARARDAERTYKRIRNLADSGSAATQRMDDAKTAMDSAQANAKAAQAVLDLALAGPRSEDIAVAEATQQASLAELGLAKRELEETQLIAPSDGVIRDRVLEVGDMASPMRPVLTLALTNPVWVRAYLSGSDLGKVAPGMRAEVTTDSFPDKPYEGWIGFISPTAEFTPKPVETTELRTKLVYQVRVYVHNPQNQLRLGMPATVRIALDQPSSEDKEASGKVEVNGDP